MPERGPRGRWRLRQTCPAQPALRQRKRSPPRALQDIPGVHPRPHRREPADSEKQREGYDSDMSASRAGSLGRVLSRPVAARTGVRADQTTGTPAVTAGPRSDTERAVSGGPGVGSFNPGPEGQRPSRPRSYGAPRSGREELSRPVQSRTCRPGRRRRPGPGQSARRPGRADGGPACVARHERAIAGSDSTYRAGLRRSASRAVGQARGACLVSLRAGVK